MLMKLLLLDEFFDSCQKETKILLKSHLNNDNYEIL